MAEPWNEQDTSAVVQAVTDTRDPVVAACAVIGGMVGVLVHYEGDDFARLMLAEIAAMKFPPDVANSNFNKGCGP
jgi:hypothetical protein